MGDSPEHETDDHERPSAAELEAAGQDSMFGIAERSAAPIPAPPPPPPTAAPQSEPSSPKPEPDAGQPYRVLARKYRPQTFSALIGQEPMVRTLANAIERDRLAHAFLMTGVRGVGKTSTARLIAKALNCIGPDGQGGPTIDPCGECEPCIAIAEGRHIDVIEMDAASNTGVDDVREIIEAVRYAAVSARYKIYIVDEVHMLSRNAFNALLKTLEEPPEHVKFLFATTEVDKLPVTVLSRTQRFDLRRIPTGMLASHFGWVCEQEGVEAQDEALAMIAAAAEGSVRDGLSILDQAIAHADLDGEGQVTADRVRDMLGLADKGVKRRLLDAILSGDAQGTLHAVGEQHALGVEPIALLRGLMDLVHRVTLTQVGQGEPEGASEEERAALGKWAEALGPTQLHRLWQLLLKGYEEVGTAPDPLVSAQMALLRLIHALDMPDPGELARRLETIERNGAAVPAPTPQAGTDGTNATLTAQHVAPSGSAAEPPAPDWEALVDGIEAAGHLQAAQLMRDWVRVVELRSGTLRYALAEGLHSDPGPELRDALHRFTGQRWEVERIDDPGQPGEPSLRERREEQEAKAREAVRAHPLVEAAFAAFPDAKMIDADDTVAQAQPDRWQSRSNRSA